MGFPVAGGEPITAADMNAAAGLPVADFASLPATGNWLGRLITTTDTEITYRFDGAWVEWLGDSGWIAPTILNSWSGSTVRYRKLNGVVYLRGRLTETSATFNKAFELPAGYRPAVDLNVVILTGASMPGTAERCEIGTDGDVTVTRFVETTKNLDGISFPVG